MSATRREFLAIPAAAFATLFSTSVAVPVQQAEGRLIGVVPVGRRDRRSPPLETPLSSGANFRLFTDLSTLSKETLVPESGRFFVRTGCPEPVPAADAWSLEIGGLVDRARSLSLAELRRLVRPVGTYLIECAGNGDATNFGLMCTAQWEGVPVGLLLDRVRPQSQARRVLVSGIDFSEPTPTSIPGASWIFTRDELEASGAFLALQMNGEPLARDHGLPARLVVPNWYGCASIKWVNRIAFVEDDVAATPQMLEYAVRTHQPRGLTLAREFQPAQIDHAATVIRVEKWLVRNRVEYRVVGVLWGGSRPTNALQIRFNRDETFERVDDCPLPTSTTTWSLWSHVWRPRSPGWYQVALRIADPSIRTRRLDRNFYARDVDIAEV